MAFRICEKTLETVDDQISEFGVRQRVSRIDRMKTLETETVAVKRYDERLVRA